MLADDALWTVGADDSADGWLPQRTWVRSLDGTQGRGIIVFESEAAATAAAAAAAKGPPHGAPVTFLSAEDFELVALA